jgi:hypothetical protein
MNTQHYMITKLSRFTPTLLKMLALSAISHFRRGVNGVFTFL